MLLNIDGGYSGIRFSACHFIPRHEKSLLPTLSKDVKLNVTEESVEAVSCGKRYVFPREDVTLLDIPTTTAEEMSKMMTLRMVAEIDFPENVRYVSVGLDEERGQTAWYREVL